MMADTVNPTDPDETTPETPDDELDEALEESFPASDPPAVGDFD